MILDSCFLIDVMSGDDAAGAKLNEIVGQPRPTALAAPSVTEVERGLRDGPQRQQFRSVIDELTIVPYDHRTAKQAADILRTLDDRGESIGTLDAMVSATALVRDDPVVTRNVSEFDRVDGLTVTPY